MKNRKQKKLKNNTILRILTLIIFFQFSGLNNGYASIEIISSVDVPKVVSLLEIMIRDGMGLTRSQLSLPILQNARQKTQVSWKHLPFAELSYKLAVNITQKMVFLAHQENEDLSQVDEFQSDPIIENSAKKLFQGFSSVSSALNLMEKGVSLVSNHSLFDAHLSQDSSTLIGYESLFWNKNEMNAGLNKKWDSIEALPVRSESVIENDLSGLGEENTLASEWMERKIKISSLLGHHLLMGSSDKDDSMFMNNRITYNFTQVRTTWVNFFKGYSQA